MAQTTLDQRMLGVGTALTDHTITASDVITFADVGDSNLTKKDTVQGVLDLAGGGALVHLSSQTASGASTLDFTQISSTYNTYRFVFENVLNSSNNTSFAIRTSTDGGSSYDSGASDYFRTGFWENGGSITLNVGNEAHGYFNSAGVYSTASNGGLSGSLELYNPLGTSYTHFVAATIASDSADNPTAHFFAGHRQSAADVNAVQFKFDSGNIASGTIRMYGYVKS